MVSPPCLSEKAAETTSPAAVGSAVKESVPGKPRHWAKDVAGFPAPHSLGSEFSAGAPPGQRFRRRRVPGNRLGQIALRSQFGHWALRSEGAWGVPCLSPHPCYSSPLGHDRRGFFVKCGFPP